MSKNTSRPAAVRNHSTIITMEQEQQVKTGRIRMMTVLRRTTVRARLCGGL